MLTLRRAGVSDPRVLAAVDACRREVFIEQAFADLAQEDVAIPLPCGQTSLRPSALAMMLEALEVRPESRLLLVGAGAGYSVAVAARIAKSVVALERYRTLTERAAGNLAQDGVENAHVILQDGLTAFEGEGPFDRILLTGGVASLPDQLLEILPADGVLVAPVNSAAAPDTCVVQRWRFGAIQPDSLFAMAVDPLEPGLPRVL